MNVHPDGILGSDFKPAQEQQVFRPQGAEFSYKDLYRFILRRRFVLLSVGWLVACMIFAASILQEPRYTATALLMVSAPQSQLGDVAQSNPIPDSGFIDSQIEILKSRKLASIVVDDLKFLEDPDWNPTIREGRYFWGLGAKIQLATPKSANAAINQRRAKEAVITAVANSVYAKRRALTYVIEVSATASKPDQAGQLANALVDAYFKNDLQMRVTSAQKSNGWLGDRLSVLKTQVQEKEQAVEAYRATTGLLTASGATLTEQQVTEMQGAVMTARADLAEKQARYRQLEEMKRKGEDPDSIAEALGSGTIATLRAKDADIAGRQAEMERRYGELHPSLSAIRTERQRIQDQITAEISRVATNLRNEVEVAQARLSTLQGDANRVQGRLVSNNEGNVKLRELERDAEATRAIYESFLKRFQEVSEAQTMKETDARVISDATIPNAPSSPRLSSALFIALLAGLVAGLAAGVALELFDEGLEGLEDVARETGKPCLAPLQIVRKATLERLPPEHRHPGGYLVEKPMSAFAEGLRVLRASLLYSESGLIPKVVAVTSALAGEGKTTVSICLARIAALAGQRVIVVDCDLRRHSFNKLLDIDVSSGIAQVLADKVSWKDVIVKDPATGFHLLPAAASSFTPRDVFGDAAMKSLLSELRNAYDLIILDSPPVLAVAETRIISRLADQTIMIVRWAKTSRRVIRIAINQLETSGGFVAGVALNCVDPQAPGRGEYSVPGYRNAYASGYYTA